MAIWHLILMVLVLLLSGCVQGNETDKDSFTSDFSREVVYNCPVLNASRDKTVDVGQVDSAWRVEVDKLLNYTSFLEKRLQDAERLQYLCKDYTYPRCPANWAMISFDWCTGSMKPNFDCQDEIKAFNPSSYPLYSLDVCDVVTFDLPEQASFESKDDWGRIVRVDRLTHRIISINGSRFITKGDANNLADKYQPVRSDMRWVACK